MLRISLIQIDSKLSIYIKGKCLSVCLFVCLSVHNFQNAYSRRPRIRNNPPNHLSNSPCREAFVEHKAKMKKMKCFTMLTKSKLLKIYRVAHK